MNIHVSEARLRRSKTHARRGRPPFDCIALLLQGGGALGAYQGGVYQGLAEADLHPDWVAGISIGAINSALIAGNPPERRVDQLRGFWDAITLKPLFGAPAALDPPRNEGAGEGTPADHIGELWKKVCDDTITLWGGPSFAPRGSVARGLASQVNAGMAAALGAPGMFSPRTFSPWLQPPGTLEGTSYYDTSALRTTLERFVDFDRINAGEMRFSVGAVN